MGARSEYAPGTFSWVDLSTGDASAAKAFYGGLFGWAFEDNEIPGGGVYTMCSLNGASVCAIAEQPSVPPHWNNYVTVASADDAVAKARGLGAKVIEGAFDVMDAGRMGLIADPAGAALCVWEAKENIGAGVVNVPGALTWNELHTSDIDGARAFYGELLGWTTREMTADGGPAYHVIRQGERSNGGIMETQEGESANWVPYFATSSLEDALAKLSEGGGERVAGPISFPGGQIAVARDPEGAPFCLWEGELED
jgi:predicted enzyme related to lactoylglutathione lyase